MNIALIGATGKTGSLVLKTALSNGHLVKALVRGTGRIKSSEQLEVIEGNGTDKDALKKLVQNVDAVIVTINHMVNKPGLSTHRDIAEAVCDAIRNYNPDAHMIMQTSASHGLRGFEHSAGKMMASVMGFILDHVIADHRAAEHILKSTDKAFRYTVFCPPKIVKSAAVGGIVLGVDELPQGNFTITYHDLAKALVEEAENPKYIRQRVGINGTLKVTNVESSSAEPLRLLWQNIKMKVLRLGSPE